MVFYTGMDMTWTETLEARVQELERRVAELETALRRGHVVETAPANG
jgi:uncharacterized protein YceH (UPF0502 family)